MSQSSGLSKPGRMDVLFLGLALVGVSVAVASLGPDTDAVRELRAVEKELPTDFYPTVPAPDRVRLLVFRVRDLENAREQNSRAVLDMSQRLEESQ